MKKRKKKYKLKCSIQKSKLNHNKAKPMRAFNKMINRSLPIIKFLSKMKFLQIKNKEKEIELKNG